MYTGRENFCTDFKSIAAEAAQEDGTVPKAAKKFLERGRKKKPYIMGNRAWKN